MKHINSLSVAKPVTAMMGRPGMKFAMWQWMDEDMWVWMNDVMAGYKGITPS